MFALPVGALSKALTYIERHGRVRQGWFGTDVSFVLDALTYLLSATLIAGVRLPKRAAREKRRLTFARAIGITETTPTAVRNKA